MIKKITVLYTDGTYDDVGEDYFKTLDKINYKNLENSDLENKSLKEIKEVYVYYMSGQYVRVSHNDNGRLR